MLRRSVSSGSNLTATCWFARSPQQRATEPNNATTGAARGVEESKATRICSKLGLTREKKIHHWSIRREYCIAIFSAGIVLIVCKCIYVLQIQNIYYDLSIDNLGLNMRLRKVSYVIGRNLRVPCSEEMSDLRYRGDAHEHHRIFMKSKQVNAPIL